jgi:rare lipoprotein A
MMMCCVSPGHGGCGGSCGCNRQHECCRHDLKEKEKEKPPETPWIGILLLAVLIGVVAIVGESDSDDDNSEQSGSTRPIIQKTENARPTVGPPYRENQTWFVPSVQDDYAEEGVAELASEEGIASWYGAGSNGRRTRSGEIFDETKLTAAHPTLPIPSWVLVTNLDNDRSVRVKVNDRGLVGSDRIINVSREAARQLGFERQGTARVRVRYLGPEYARSGGRVVPASAMIGAARPPIENPTQRVVYRSIFRPDTQRTEAEARGLPPPGPPAPPPHEEEGEYYIQLGAFRDLASAQNVGRRVAGSEIRSVQSGGAMMYRVVVGPWDSERAVESARASLASSGFRDAWITRRSAP